MTSGIYIIEHIMSGRQYVGSAVDIENRWSNHKTTLNQGTHPNTYLQRAWRRYGAQAFEFILVEVSEVQTLTEREQYWMDQTQACDPKLGFNLQPKARSSLGSKRGAVTKQKMSEAAKRRNADPEYKQMLRERARRQWAEGRIHPGEVTEVRRQRISAAVRAWHARNGRGS